jgi:cytochrome c oxidase subunit 2
MTRRTILPAALGAAVLLAAAGPVLTRSEEPARVVEIRAHRFQFEPAQVTLRRGETVKLVLRSDDVVHGFFSRPLGIDTEIHPGAPTEIVVTPTAAGRFVTICDHFCGAGHGNMSLTFVVE